MAENKFQSDLIKELQELFPGCEILKNDSGYKQGILDLTILWGRCWAMLEAKASRTSRMRPNQDYYIDKFNGMSFAAKIFPENKEEVLAALQKAFASRESSCVPKS